MKPNNIFFKVLYKTGQAGTSDVGGGRSREEVMEKQERSTEEKSKVQFLLRPQKPF